MRRATTLILIVAAAAAALAIERWDSREPADESIAQVTRVVDGDTIVVRLGGQQERVRYIGIDTPESVRPGTEPQCFAKAAASANARLVDGERVRLTLDAEPRDRYGRLLAYVHRERDGTFVNAELVRGGYARVLTIRPNVRHAKLFARLADEARRKRRGLWASCDR